MKAQIRPEEIVIVGLSRKRTRLGQQKYQILAHMGHTVLKISKSADEAGIKECEEWLTRSGYTCLGTDFPECFEWYKAN